MVHRRHSAVRRRRRATATGSVCQTATHSLNQSSLLHRRSVCRLVLLVLVGRSFGSIRSIAHATSRSSTKNRSSRRIWNWRRCITMVIVVVVAVGRRRHDIVTGSPSHTACTGTFSRWRGILLFIVKEDVVVVLLINQISHACGTLMLILLVLVGEQFPRRLWML